MSLVFLTYFHYIFIFLIGFIKFFYYISSDRSKIVSFGFFFQLLYFLFKIEINTSIKTFFVDTNHRQSSFIHKSKMFI